MWEPGFLVVIALVIVFIVAGLALAANATRGRGRTTTGSTPAVWMSVGMLFGAALGAIVWISTDQFVFWVIFMGGGMVTGLSIGTARARNRG